MQVLDNFVTFVSQIESIYPNQYLMMKYLKKILSYPLWKVTIVVVIITWLYNKWYYNMMFDRWVACDATDSEAYRVVNHQSLMSDVIADTLAIILLYAVLRAIIIRIMRRYENE